MADSGAKALLVEKTLAPQAIEAMRALAGAMVFRRA
jgi:hypothetical protein